MKLGRFLSVFVILCALFSGIYSYSVGGETAEVYPYAVSVVYKYQNRIDAVDIVKTSEFTGTDDVLLVAARAENGETVRAQAVFLDENLPVGVNEISVSDFEIEENQTVFVTVWDSISSLTPLTNGVVPEITVENERVAGESGDWTVSPDGKRIIAYTGGENEVVIPNYLSGKHITAVGAYSSQDNMVSIFGDRAEEITSLEISEGIKKIGPTSFYGCKGITSTVDIPGSVDYIGVYAFYNCIKMSGELIIPDGVEYIYGAAFAGCFEITSVTFSENLKSIGDYAFYGCIALSGGLEMPESLILVGDYAFYGCAELEGSLENSKNVSRIGDYAFCGCEKLTGGLELSGAAYIGEGAFAWCTGFNGGLSFSDNLEHIGAGAFEGCSRLTGQLVFPQSLVYIGDAAFNHCIGFTNEVLIIPENVAVLGGDLGVEENTNYSSHLFFDFGRNDLFKAFGVAPENEYFCAVDGVLYDINMERLVAYPRGKTDEAFEIPEGVTQLDELSIGRCLFLKEIILPDSYVIEERAPENVINQNGNTLAVALYHRTGVERVLVKETNPNYISRDGILYSADGKSLWYCPVKKGGDVEIYEGTERIETGAFYGVESENTITSLKIPASVTYIAPETVNVINYLYDGNIVVDEGNANYYVSEGLIRVVE